MTLSRYLHLRVMTWVFVGVMGCGGDTPAEKPKAKQAEAAKPAPVPSKSLDTLSEERVLALGERIYKTTGSNTCNDCHGMAGYGGRLKEAADLRKPTTWKAYKTAGGDLEAMRKPVIELIRIGAGQWNQKHPEPIYDVNMLGVVQGATKTNLRKIRKELKKKDGIVLSMDEAIAFGADAVYAYVETIWTDEGGAAPPAAVPPSDAPVPPSKTGGDEAP